MTEIKRGHESCDPAICDCSVYSPNKWEKKTSVWKSESEAARKTDIEKWVTAGIIPDCGFRILLCVSGWCWIIEVQQSQAQLCSLQWNIWRHNSNVASCADKWGERDALYPLSAYWLPGLIHFTEITRRFRLSTGDRKHIAASNHYMSFSTRTSSNNVFHLYLPLDSMRLLSANTFLVCRTTSSAFSAVRLCHARFMKSVQVPMKCCHVWFSVMK